VGSLCSQKSAIASSVAKLNGVLKTKLAALRSSGELIVGCPPGNTTGGIETNIAQCMADAWSGSGRKLQHAAEDAANDGPRIIAIDPLNKSERGTITVGSDVEESRAEMISQNGDLTETISDNMNPSDLRANSRSANVLIAGMRVAPVRGDYLSVTNNASTFCLRGDMVIQWATSDGEKVKVSGISCFNGEAASGWALRCDLVGDQRLNGSDI